MPEALKYLLAFPAWIATPIVVVTLLLTLWPQIRQMIADVTYTDRKLEHEKRHLELVKLRYEIEAIKKANGLESLPHEVAATPVPSTTASQSDVRSVSSSSGSSILTRFAAGCARCLIPRFTDYDRVSQQSQRALSRPCLLPWRCDALRGGRSWCFGCSRRRANWGFLRQWWHFDCDSHPDGGCHSGPAEHRRTASEALHTTANKAIAASPRSS